MPLIQIRNQHTSFIERISGALHITVAAMLAVLVVVGIGTMTGVSYQGQASAPYAELKQHVSNGYAQLKRLTFRV